MRVDKIDNGPGVHVEARMKPVIFYFLTVNYCYRGIDHFLAKFNLYIYIYIYIYTYIRGTYTWNIYIYSSKPNMVLESAQLKLFHFFASLGNKMTT